jgi:hypothetical protein
MDDRPKEIIEKFPLRKIRLDMCICGHDDSYHETEFDSETLPAVKDGACSICVCKGFELP